MPLSLSLTSLGSRVIRSAVGSRIFSRRGASTSSSDDEGNILVRAWNGINRFGNSLMAESLKLLGNGIQITWTAIWSLTVSTSTFLWHFNWNASDAELDAQIKSAFDSLAGILGGTLGNALGWLACGAVPGAIIFAFNEPMGLYVLEKVGEEALDEIAGNVATLIRATAQSAIKAGAIYLYKNIRNLWRESDSEFVKRLKAEGLVDQAKIDKALADRNKPWSFAKTTEDAIESIPNTFWRNFTEEFVEEFFESCTEAGYVVANSVDSYLAQQKMANETVMGSEQTIEILLERGSDDSTPNS